MKKTLIALATLAAAGTAFAQSSVSITGILDIAAASIGGNATTANTKLNTVNASNGAATSAINFNIVEDLGGGLRAQAFYAIDPRAIINSTASNFGRHETFVGLTGGFGQIRMGSINTASLQANGAASVFGTATGSGYTDLQLAAGGATRFANSVRYDTPNVNGFAASLTYAPGNDDATTGGALAATTDLGVSYSKGPLSVNFSNLSRSATAAQAQVNGSATALQVNAVAATEKSTYNMIGANYTMGAVRLFAGYGKGDKSSLNTSGEFSPVARGQDTTLTRFGGTYTMGAVAFHAGYATLEVGTAAKRTTTGLRADYALSKRTTTYVGYEAFDTGATTANKRTVAMVGVRHNF